MDMEEMKKGWMVLNERLSQNEILNRRIIKEILTTRTRTAYEQVYNWEWRNFFILLFIAAIIAPAQKFLSDIPITWVSFIVVELGALVALISKLVSISCLRQFNLVTLKSNRLLRLILVYKRYRWYETVFGTILGLVLLVILIVLENIYLRPFGLVAIGVMLVFGLGFSFSRLRKYAKRVKDIERGLAELEEFEE